MATMGEMAAGIAHELNQPLSAIATYARACERFLNSAQPDLPETLSSLAEISAEAMRAGDMIRRLRQLVSSQASDHEVTQVNDLVRDLGVLMQADARVHRTQIDFEIEPTLPLVHADRAQLQLAADSSMPLPAGLKDRRSAAPMPAVRACSIPGAGSSPENRERRKLP